MISHEARVRPTSRRHTHGGLIDNCKCYNYTLTVYEKNGSLGASAHLDCVAFCFCRLPKVSPLSLSPTFSVEEAP